MTPERRLGRWLRRLPRDRPPALIMGASVNGLSFVRSLARRGVPTLLLDSDHLLGTYTRFGETLLLPMVDEHADRWLEVLAALAARLPEPAVLFATSDAHVVFLAEHQEELGRGFRFLVPGPAAIERIVNKRLQYTIAEANGIPIPCTGFPRSVAEARSLASGLSYPAILKPCKSHVGRRKITKKVVVANSAAELVDMYDRVATDGVEFMVQEIIPGPDTALFGYLAFWDAEGRERAWLTKRKLRQNWAFGDGSLQVTLDAPEVADLSRRLLSALDYRGFAGVEFRQDPRDGVYRLMEINPRTVSGNQLAITAGVDFPWLGYRYLTEPGAAGGTLPSFRRGVVYVNEEWDIKAYLSLRKSGCLSFAEWARSFASARARAIWAWDDPYPLLVVLGRIVRSLFRRKTYDEWS